MARSLTDYLLNPFFNIYFFIHGDDFQNNYLYFFLIELICILADFFCFVYNEFIIVSWCGLEYDTKDGIIKRAIKSEINYSIMEDVDEDDQTNNE